MEFPVGEATVECAHCRWQFAVDASDLDIQESGADERQMGPEIFYFGQLNLSCPSCGGEIEISHEASEYPVGVPNYGETFISGGRFILEFSDRRQPFLLQGSQPALYDGSDLYVPEAKPIITAVSTGVAALIDAVNANPQELYRLSSREFEELVAEVLKRHGLDVQLTKRTRDGGRDIVAFKPLLGTPLKLLIECKRYAPDRRVGVELVRSLYGVVQQEGATMGLLATTARFTRDAKDFASQPHTTKWSMALKDFDDIREWVRDATAKRR